jgi:hypothetical protein
METGKSTMDMMKRECNIFCVNGYSVYSIKGEKLWPSQIPPTSSLMNS